MWLKKNDPRATLLGKIKKRLKRTGRQIPETSREWLQQLPLDELEAVANSPSTYRLFIALGLEREMPPRTRKR